MENFIGRGCVTSGRSAMLRTMADRTSPVACVIASRARPELPPAALAWVLRARRPGDDVVVVDSASRDDSTRRVAEDAGVRCVRCDVAGVARARNAGLRATEAPIVAFTDDDCLVAPDWVASVAATFADANTDVAFVTGRVLPDQQVAEMLSVLVDETPRRFTGVQEPSGIGHGANMAWRRVAFEAIDGFDESLGPGAVLRYAEEHDAFWRVLRQGGAGVYEPSVVVTHRQWRGRAEFLRIKWGYGFGTGAFASKVVRLDPALGSRMLQESVWDRGVGQAWRDLRAGYE